MCGQQGGREPRRLTPKHQVIAWRVARGKIASPGVGREEVHSRTMTPLVELWPVLVHVHVNISPVVQAGTLERAVIEGKSEGSDEVQTRASRDAQSGNVAGVGWNFRRDQDDVQH